MSKASVIGNSTKVACNALAVRCPCQYQCRATCMSSFSRPRTTVFITIAEIACAFCCRRLLCGYGPVIGTAALQHMTPKALCLWLTKIMTYQILTFRHVITIRQLLKIDRNIPLSICSKNSQLTVNCLL